MRYLHQDTIDPKKMNNYRKDLSELSKNSIKQDIDQIQNYLR